MFDKTDLGSYRAFKKIITSSSLKLKGDAVQVTASLFKWFDTLEEKIEKSLKGEKKKSGPVIKPIEENTLKGK